MWVVLLGYFFVHTFFSDSVGYSISTTIRLVDAYLLYLLFYSLAERNLTKVFASLVMFVGAVATLASFVCLLAPSFVRWLPQMNLLYATYGHNQLADLLLFCIPLTMEDWIPTQTVINKLLLVLFLIGLAVSFARGAWVLLLMYFVYLLLTKQRLDSFKKTVVWICVGAFTGLLLLSFLLTVLFSHAQLLQNGEWMYRQLIKPSVYEQRLPYWEQAFAGIQINSIIGSGPGTFLLISKKYQINPNEYSWFSHNFFLDQLVEVGLIGAILWGIFFVVQARLLRKECSSPLVMSIVLTLLYSCVEYNLNFLAIWVLFWSTLGWITGVGQDQKESRSRPSLFVLGGISVLFVFSLVSSIGVVATMNHKSDVAFLSMPFSADTAIISLENHEKSATVIPQNDISLLLFFHAKNPEVLYALARYYVAIHQPAAAMRWYEATIQQDPKNFIYQQEYLQLLIQNTLFLQASLETRQFSVNLLPGKLWGEVNGLPLRSADFTPAWSPVFIEKITSNPTDLYFAKLYYLLGNNVLSHNSELTKQLWTLARDIYPDMGLLYHELASLEFYDFHDAAAAQKIIASCMKVPHAALHCRQILPDFSNVPPPGYVAGDIIQYHE
jgi:O-antigen ligase